ncbi:recombinase family protein [Paenibacillus sp. P96]|uniref:Recombinase family protein n=1 Tax=Paenibacillus zeirhizosphaerae TaxID=2987519 RepID=A0ABT9FWK6_9BACL|nr:recombinase family protein [Paenibacillus sp. P96]MDP4099109.1 recombinase family protein [Paenibacillus sp. P96]
MKDATSILFGATYLRISRDKGENEDTLQNHREMMAAFCQQNGFTYDIYEEIVSGGKYELEDRPQLQRLLENIEKYQAIFTVSLDRLSRNGLVSQQIKQLCMDHEIKIITPSQTFDLSNSQEDRVLYDVSSIFATLEYEMIGRRNQYNKRQRAQRGEYVSGKPAYGYRRNPTTHKLEIHEPEAEIVRYIFKLHIEGLGTRKIADMLNSKGYRPPRCDTFLPSTVKRIITNPVYKGSLVFQNRKRIKENGKYTFKVLDTITTDHAHPAIIPPDQWDQVHQERTERGAKAIGLREKATVKAGTTMLKDLLFCGVCGRKLTIKKERNGAYTIKRCDYVSLDREEKCENHGIRLRFVEEEILRKLQAYRRQLQQELQHMQQQNTRNTHAELQQRLIHVKDQMEENKKRRADLLDLALTGTFPRDRLKIRKERLVEQEHALQEMKEAVLQEMQALEASSGMEQMKCILALLDQFEFQTAEEQNMTLKQFIRRIHYTRLLPDDIKVLSTRSRERQEYPFGYTMEYL